MTVAEASDYIKEGQFERLTCFQRSRAAISSGEGLAVKSLSLPLNKTADAINEKLVQSLPNNHNLEIITGEQNHH